MNHLSRRVFLALSGAVSVSATWAHGDAFPRQAKEAKKTLGPAGSAASPAHQDGLADALAIAAQYPNLLSHYAVRPPWHVAGVDYGVGVPADKRLADWKSLVGAGITIGDSQVRIDNTAGIVIDSVDFSLHGGCQLLFVGSPDCTIHNCKFGGASYPQLSTGPICLDVASPGVTITHCRVDGGSVGGSENQACLIYAIGGGNISIKYNWFVNYATQVLDINTSCSLDFRFNLIDECIMSTGAHSNCLQWGSGNCTAIVEYNTYKQSTATHGEAFQFYFNREGTLSNTSLSYNTLIATGSVSYLVHGSTKAAGTTASGPLKASSNYFDLTGAYGAFYPGSTVGWIVSDNVNMRTGGIAA